MFTRFLVILDITQNVSHNFVFFFLGIKKHIKKECFCTGVIYVNLT